MQHTRTRVLAAHNQLFTIGMQQFTDNHINTIIGSRQADLLAQFNTW